MNKVYESFFSFPSDLPLHIMYRSTMPGHENCERYHYPVTRFDEAAQDPTGRRNKTYHWHWFPEYNAFAKELWGDGPLSPDSIAGQTKGGVKWQAKTDRVGDTSVETEYWDIWNLSATRPDAHIAWQGHFADCLHVRFSTDYGAQLMNSQWCPAGMYEWVIRAWWHTIVKGEY